MTVTWELIIAAVGAGSTVAVVVFQGAFKLGQMWNRLDTNESDIKRVAKRVDDHIEDRSVHVE